MCMEARRGRRGEGGITSALVWRGTYAAAQSNIGGRPALHVEPGPNLFNPQPDLDLRSAISALFLHQNGAGSTALIPQHGMRRCAGHMSRHCSNDCGICDLHVCCCLQ